MRIKIKLKPNYFPEPDNEHGNSCFAVVSLLYLDILLIHSGTVVAILWVVNKIKRFFW